MATNNSCSDNPSSAVPKKPYEKPTFRHEQVFVTSALGCGKLGTQGQCGLTNKS
jgi:hypothetical protein